MSGIVHGFEYDIFISYRQKDNKGDRWVSEFVEALDHRCTRTCQHIKVGKKLFPGPFACREVLRKKNFYLRHDTDKE